MPMSVGTAVIGSTSSGLLKRGKSRHRSRFTRGMGLLVLHLDPHPAGTPEAIRIVRADFIAQQERLHNGPFVSRPARHDRRRFV